MLYEETKRFHCRSDAGNPYVVIEQVRRSRLGLGPASSPRTDYMTDDGQVVMRLDGENFLLVMTNEVVHVQ